MITNTNTYYDTHLSLQALIFMAILKIPGRKNHSPLPACKNGNTDKFWRTVKKWQAKPDNVDSVIPKDIRSTIKVNDYPMYKIYAGTTQPDKAIYYIHGGGWVATPTKIHYRAAMQLSERANAVVYFVRYPLLPNAPLPELFEHVEKAYGVAIKDYDSQINTVMGDSAGGTFTLYLASKLQAEVQPKQFIAISPCADCNSPIDDSKLAKNDIMIPESCITNVLGPIFKDYNNIYSPTHLNFDNLIQSKAKLLMFTGGREMLYPSVYKLHQRFIKEEISHDFYFDKKMFHVYAIINAMPEGRRAFDVIVEKLNGIE